MSKQTSSTDEDACSPAYLAALAAHNAAQAIYWPIRDAYRMARIGDDEFLAAQRAMAEADKAYDAAYNAEAARQEGAAS